MYTSFMFVGHGLDGHLTSPVAENELTRGMGYTVRRRGSCEGSWTYGGPQPPTECRGHPQRATIH